MRGWLGIVYRLRQQKGLDRLVVVGVTNQQIFNEMSDKRPLAVASSDIYATSKGAVETARHVIVACWFY